MANQKEKATNPLLTIVVPAYNEGKRLPATIPQIIHYVSQQPFGVEVVIVNNNSSDDTREIADQFAADYDYIKVIDEARQGKGAAVKTGMMAGTGDYLFIADADLSMPISQVNHFLPPESGDYDVAIGSREAPGAVRYDEPEYRHIMGRVFNLIVRWFAVPGFHDTQAGFKCFTQEAARRVFPKQTVDGWAFDVEVLFIAQKLKCKIIEVPIEWHYQPNSRINPLQSSYEMFAEVFKIRQKGKQGVYD